MKFSILTPTCNRREWFPRALASVLAQTHEDWELIVRDGSDEPVFDLLPDDPRIRHFPHEPRLGPALDFQRSLELATGDVIHPLSDDDRLVPHALATVAERLGEAEWLYGQTAVVHADETFDQLLGRPFSLSALKRKYVLGGAVYWRRSLSDRVGGFDPAYDHAADYDLYFRFALAAEPVYVPEALYLYTEHPQTDTNRNHGIQQQAVERIRARFADAHPAWLEPPLALDTRRLVVLALASELVDRPELLACYTACFGATDDATLLISAPGANPEEVAALLDGAGAAEADLLLVTASAQHEGDLIDRSHVALTAGALRSGLPPVASPHELAALRAALLRAA